MGNARLIQLLQQIRQLGSLLVVTLLLSACEQNQFEHLDITDLFTYQLTQLNPVDAPPGVTPAAIDQALVQSAATTSSQVHWYEARLDKALTQPEQFAYLEIPYPIYDYVDLWYISADGSQVHYRAGDEMAFADYPLRFVGLTFPVPKDIGPGSRIRLAINTGGFLKFSAKLWPAQNYHHNFSRQQIWYGFLFGGLIILALYNLFVYLGTHDRSYLYYVLYMLSLGLFVAIAKGYGEKYLWPEYAGMANRMILFAMAGGSVFSIKFVNTFLNSKKILPASQTIASLIIGAAISIIVLAIFGLPYSWALKSLVVINSLTLIYNLSVILVALRNGRKSAVFLLIAFACFLVGTITFQLNTFGLLGDNVFTNNAISVGLLLEATLLSLALANRIHTLNREKKRAEQLAFQTQRQFAQKLIDTQEKERETFSNTLHDAIGHGMLILKQNLDRLKLQMDGTAAELQVEQLRDHCTEILGEVRTLSHDLHPHLLTRLGINAAIDSTLERAFAATEVQWFCEIDDIEEVLSKDHQIVLFRVLQEIISNVLKHAQASEMIIKITKFPDRVHALIKDDGVGFDPDHRTGTGIGIQTMRGRLSLIGGNINFFSTPGSGTRIDIVIPI